MTATAQRPQRPDAARARGMERPDAATARGAQRLDAAAVTEALTRGDCGEVHGDAGRRAQYAADASNHRQVPLAVVFPDGFSCRTQIAQRTDRAGTHLAELLARASHHQPFSSADKEPAP
ncbi:hypothetical protein ACWGMA_48175 [Streptomyces asiaticus]